MYQNRNPYFNYQNPRNMYRTPYNRGPQDFMNRSMPFSIPKGNVTRSIFPSLASLTSKGTFSRVLSSTENIIATVNQVIPLYQQISPMFKNSKILKTITGSLFRKKDTTKEVIDDVEVVDSAQTTNKTRTTNTFAEETSPNKPFFG